MSSQVEITVAPASQVSVELQQGATPSVVLNAPSVPTVVEVTAPALQSPVAVVRVDASTAGTVYVGRATYGAAESAALWTITRSLFSPAGIRTSKGTASDVTWTGRATHTYS
jgi:hypothetical protein